jgi:hypothetical protein
MQAGKDCAVQSSPTVLRQIHLDFHTSGLIPGVGADFDPAGFAKTLADAHVNSVLCFARCHHGWVYYDSTQLADRKHPTLDRALLAEQIDACHALGIRVPIYTTVQWDDLTVQAHPEWRIVLADGRLEGTPPFEAGFYRKLCLNSPFRDFMKEHAAEILASLPVDGLYFDFIRPDHCVCGYCRRGMRERGWDPSDARRVEQFGVETVNDFELELSAFVRSIQPGCPVTYNGGHVGLRHRTVAEAYTQFELETLPSGGWGYMYFPVTGRYARTLGPDVVGTTGKFHTTWGDFHSTKNPAALEYEVFRMLAQGAGCSIGDQLHPKGVLDPETYRVVGDVYAQVEHKEPWCAQALPRVDIGVFNPEENLGGGVMNLPPGIQGAVRMLVEGGHQFDVIDSAADLARYRLLVLPDHIRLTPVVAAKLRRYLDDGGSVVASYESGLAVEGDDFALAEWGVQVESDGPRDSRGEPARGKVYDRHDYCQYLRPRTGLTDRLPTVEHPMYIRGLDVSASPDAEILADLVLPYFDRTWEHYISHLQAPSTGETAGPAVVRRGRVVYFCHPIHTQYETNAPRWVKTVFLAAVGLLLPDPVVRHGGPSTLEVSVTSQPQHRRDVVHLLHYIPERRGTEFDTVEDVLPLFDVDVSLRTTTETGSVRLEPQGVDLPFHQTGSRVDFAVPRIDGHQVVAVTPRER